MKKIVFFFVTIALILPINIIQAQNTFFPTKAGTVMVYAHKDAKGNVTNHYRHTIKNVEGSPNNMTISYVMEELDKNRNPLKNPVELPLTVIIKDDIVFLDMKQLFAGQLKDTQVTAEVTGVPQELPGNLQPGQDIKDANMTVTFNAGPIRMRMEAIITNAKCEAIEDITVQAGTFKCHKVTQTTTSTVMRMKAVTQTVSWYAPGIGTVKSESYDNKNKLTNSVELVMLTQ
jgi:hypothetical protein